MKQLFKVASALALAVSSLTGIQCWAASENAQVATMDVPSFQSIKRVENREQVTPENAAFKDYILKTKAHKPIGDEYVLVTDQTDDQNLKQLRKLAAFHKGKIIQIANFASLCTDPSFRKELKEKLIAANPRFVAIAPTIQTYQENVVLAFWQILSELGPEAGIDAFPALLVAPDAESLSSLVEQSISYSVPTVKPFVVSQMTDCGDTGSRAVQKMRIMRRLFSEQGIASSGLLVRTFAARDCNQSTPIEKGEFDITQARPHTLIPTLGAGESKAIDESNLLIMFGHGVPGMTCSLDVQSFKNISMRNKIVLSGSCFSAAPLYSDLTPVQVGIDGSPVHPEKERFFQRALQNGALVFYGHMRTNAGFPELAAFYESLANGLTVGEAYQRLINANLAMGELPPNRIMIPQENIANPQAAERHNSLFYAVIGDPALCPYPKGLR